MNISQQFLKHVLGVALGLIVCSSFVAAQERTITGTVTDDFGLAPGVTVVVEGTLVGTSTMMDGRYSITYDFKPEDKLTFSSIGYITQKIPVGAKTTIDVKLKEDVVELEGLVVTGFVMEEEEDITGSVSVVNAEDMEGRNTSRIGDMITGQAAGVQVITPGGKPSQGLSIRVRGTNSINAGSEPLYVVDGVPTNDTRSINPNDIESITVLKDASSAAIYGAQGANGVVLITTKRGTSKEAEITYSTFTGFSEVWKKLDVLDADQYRELMEDLNQTTDWDQYTENTNWQDEVFQRGSSQSHQLAISGMEGGTNYYISGGWTKQVGAIRSAEMDRTNFKINLDSRLRDWVKVGTRMGYSMYSDVDVDDNRNVNYGGVLMGALATPSILGIYNEDGTFTSNPFQNWENPLASTDGSQRLYKSQRMIGNFYAEFNITDEITFKSSAGIDNAHGVYDYFLDPFLTDYGRALGGRARNNTDKSQYYVFDNILKYNKQTEKSFLEVLGGAVQQKFRWENNYLSTENFASNAVTTANAGANITSASNSKSEKANMSYISRVHYEWDERYLMTANFRADGSSVFGPATRWGYFPSVSGGWRLSEESFMDSLTWVDEVKIRAGWGVVGNDQIGASNYSYLGLIGQGANYPIGGTAQPGSYPASISNDGLKWEESRQTNIGLDVRVLDDRVGVTVDAYLKRTTDLLLNSPLPRTTGFDNAVQNIGELENKGLEFAFNTVNFEQDSGFKWTSNFNISFNRNKVVNIQGDELYAGYIDQRGEVSLVREGEPLGTLYGYIYGGVNPDNGRAFYIDQDGESQFVPEAEDRVIIGDANPDFMFGITNTFTYKNLALRIFLQGTKGNQLFNATRLFMEAMSDPKNQSTAVLDRWQEKGDETDIPRALWGYSPNTYISDRFVEDASYLRIKSVVLSYDLPQDWLTKIYLKDVSVYVSGENLLTFTNYSGFDPEVNAFGSSNTAQGVDFGTYPQTRNIIAGINITL